MTKVINLTDLNKPAAVVLIIDDVRHEMKNPTVGDYIANTELVQALGIKSSPLEETMVMIEMVLRAFPTLTREQILLWPTDYIHQISDIARGTGGEVATTDADAAAASAKTGNAQPAS